MMAKIWVLFLLFSGSYHGGAVTNDRLEFQSKSSCLSAGQVIARETERAYHKAYFACIEQDKK